MSHYEERLEQDLGNIRSGIADMASRVEAAVKDAVHALQTGDHQLAATTILRDHPINRQMRELDHLCHAFIAVHLPSAKHLRIISSIIRANIALERIGDYAVTIARVSEQASTPPAGQIAREVERIANEARTMLSQAVAAFNSFNGEQAKATMIMEQELEYDLEALYAELMAEPDRQQFEALLDLFIVLTHLKRVADQAKNLCEQTVFAASGVGKAPKTYNILFMDEDNSCLSQMAEAVARKNFPQSGNYSSGGRQPAAHLHPAMAQFMEEHGFDLTTAKPKPLDLTHQELTEKHVVVSLQGQARSYFPRFPFHTTAIEWDVGPVPSSDDITKTAAQLEDSYRKIAVHVRDLIELLRGEDAH